MSSDDRIKALAGHRHPILRQFACRDTDPGGWMPDAAFQEVLGRTTLQPGVLEEWIRLGLVLRSGEGAAVRWQIAYRGPYDDRKRVYLVVGKEPGVLGKQLTRRLAIRDGSALSDTPRHLSVGVESFAAVDVWFDHQTGTINFIAEGGALTTYQILREYI